MSIHVDRTFLLRISPKLDKFTRKKDDLYNFRCPLCGDSQKDKNKARGYVYRRADAYLYMCHNCGASTTFYALLKAVDPSSIDDYSLERYRDTQPVVMPEPVKEPEKPPTAVEICGKSIAESHEYLPESYLLKRNIPKKYWDDLYYTTNFNYFVRATGIHDKEVPDGPRLIIPFRDANGKLIGYQGRALDESPIRYITIRLREGPMMFGLNHINRNQPIYVLEGPFDSMFINNCVAIASSNLTGIESEIPKENVILVFDNEPRNKDIVKLMEKAIDNHWSVVVWPPMIEEKDINDMILAGWTDEELHDILETNTFVNLRAKMEFLNWKKTQ